MDPTWGLMDPTQLAYSIGAFVLFLLTALATVQRLGGAEPVETTPAGDTTGYDDGVAWACVVSETEGED